MRAARKLESQKENTTMTDPLAHSRLKHALSAIPPDQRRQEIDNALREIEGDERDQKLWEWFGNLPIEDKEALYGALPSKRKND
jgi:hypothetical protein